MKHYIAIVLCLITLSGTIKAMEAPSPDAVTFQNDPKFKVLEAEAMKLRAANKQPLEWQTLLVDFGQLIASNKLWLENYSRKAKAKLLFVGKPDLWNRIETAMKHFGANSLSLYVDASAIVQERLGMGKGTEPKDLEAALKQAADAANAVKTAADAYNGTDAGKVREIIKTKVAAPLNAIKSS